jgi:peptidoglycan/xylan/chitin deacetylase (PgdA/CDA1 family)
MYHYIGNITKKFPYYRKLSISSFDKQLKKFSEIGLVNKYKELFLPSKKVIMTFDDGLKDHIYAAEKLKKLSSTGIFFISTMPYKNHQILDVHKTHLITGKIDGSEILDQMNKYLTKNKIKNFSDPNEERKFDKKYKVDDQDQSIKKFKKLMNFCGEINLRTKILNHLLKYFEINYKYSDYYLTKKEIRYLRYLGMIIGAHTETHSVLSRMNYKQQFKEINNCKKYLQNITNSEINLFCYPYGDKTSYNHNTIKILRKLKFKQAYSVLKKDISSYYLKNKYLELPRYDCNLF